MAAACPAVQLQRLRQPLPAWQTRPCCQPTLACLLQSLAGQHLTPSERRLLLTVQAARCCQVLPAAQVPAACRWAVLSRLRGAEPGAHPAVAARPAARCHDAAAAAAAASCCLATRWLVSQCCHLRQLSPLRTLLLLPPPCQQPRPHAALQHAQPPGPLPQATVQPPPCNSACVRGRRIARHTSRVLEVCLYA